MASLVLWQRAIPAEHAREMRLSVKSENHFQLVARDRFQHRVVILEQVRQARTRKETTQQHSAIRSAMRKFLVHKRARHHLAAFRARDQKTMTFLQSGLVI